MPGGPEFVRELLEGGAPAEALAMDLGQGVGGEPTDATPGNCPSLLHILRIHVDLLIF